jgi:hypothetical protein
MSSDAAFTPQVIHGGGFDPAALADQLWSQGMYDEANNVGRMVPDVEGRTCGLTGYQAHGYARVPGTDVPISHGMYESTPTAYQRWTGFEGRPPARPTAKVASSGNYTVTRWARTDNGPSQGGEAVLAVLGAHEGSVLVFDYVTLPDGRTVTTVAVDRPKPVEG